MILSLKQNTNIEFYQCLGKLFYAIAATDNYIRDEELEKLKEVLDNEWMVLDNFCTTDKATIINTFEWLLNDNEYDSEVCYNSFLSYKREHEELFESSMKALILKTAGKIASSFSRENKSELIFLAKLSIEFKDKNTNSTSK